MKPSPQLPERESRFLSASVELRAAAETEKPAIVRGYAAKFNVESENLGGGNSEMREYIAPGAFDDVLNDDVRALFNHESSAILARSKNGMGSLRLSVDEVGLAYEFEAPDTQLGRDLVTSIGRGDVDQSSFSFTVADDTWEESRQENGSTLYKRTINKIKRLFDVSPVTYPAYPDATVALRSLQEFQKQEEIPDLTPSDEESRKAWAAFYGFKATPPETKE